MSFNPWLITWEIINETAIPENLIAAILPKRTSVENVTRIMYLLSHNQGGKMQDQVRFAKHQHVNKVQCEPMVTKLFLCGRPSLCARQVFDFKLKTEMDGDEVATWEDHDFELPDMRKNGRATYEIVRQRTYRRSSGTISSEIPVRRDLPEGDSFLKALEEYKA